MDKKEFSEVFKKIVIERENIIENKEEIDILAEVYKNDKLVFILAKSGDIIYKDIDYEQDNEFIKEAITKTRQDLNISNNSDIESTDNYETLKLLRATYDKIMKMKNCIARKR